MPKIKHSLAQGFGKGELYDMLIAILTDLTELKTKYEDHRHSAIGDSPTGTKPSTAGGTAGDEPSTITLTVTK